MPFDRGHPADDPDVEFLMVFLVGGSEFELFHVHAARDQTHTVARHTEILDHVPGDHIAGHDHPLAPAHDETEKMFTVVSMAGGDKTSPRLAAGQECRPGRVTRTGVDDIDLFLADDIGQQRDHLEDMHKGFLMHRQLVMHSADRLQFPDHFPAVGDHHGFMAGFDQVLGQIDRSPLYAANPQFRQYL